jgi:UDP-N-acetylmuramate dehydrogenase
MPIDLIENYPTNLLTTLGIGGSTRYYCQAQNLQEMEEALAFARKNNLPCLIIGRGSNLLIDDQGYDGIIIQNRIDHFSVAEDHFTCGGGLSFPLLAQRSTSLGFGGMEFAIGIPGTVGGAIAMNAGASGVETSIHLHSVTFLHLNGQIETFSKDQLIFGYRHSPFLNMQGAIIEATFQLYPDSNAKKKMLEIFEYRKRTQPYHQKSAGCIFCNPPSNEITQKVQSAGALIEQAGLKGFCIGDAQVSTLHANFLINHHAATFQQMQELISFIQTTILERDGIYLSPEVRVIQKKFSSGLKDHPKDYLSQEISCLR